MNNQAFHQIYGRIERFSKKLGVVCHGCVSIRHGPPPSLSHQYYAFKIWCRTAKLVSVKLRTPKIIQNYQILGFAGVCRFLRVMCIYMRWCSGYENGLVCPWDVARMQAMFSQTRQTSRIRRDSENWVILGHTSKVSKIIDRWDVQVYDGYMDI